MIEVLNLALPFFGLIVIGFVCGRIKQIPDTALGWMNFFIVYVSLPALFYRILAQTPLDQLAQIDFIFATTLATFWAFAVSFAIGMVIRKGNIGESAIAGLAGGYGNIGYMGPGLALATLGQQAAVPVALIFCFDNIILFTMVPFLMALRGNQPVSVGAVALEVVKRVAGHPLIIASALGVLSAAVHFQPPVGLDRLLQFLQNAAAPLRAVHARCDGGAPPATEDAVGNPVHHGGEAAAAPAAGVSAAVAVRAVPAVLDRNGNINGGPAAGVECVRVRAPIRHLGRAGFERGAGRHVGVGCDADDGDVAGEVGLATAVVV